MSKRIYLSAPHMGGREMGFIREAFRTNWVAPVGPHVDAFEARFARRVGLKHAVALSSGTAALHLSLRHLGVGPGDEVWCSTFTFAATANAVVYERAKPVFIDSEPRTWNMDPDLLEEALRKAEKRNKLPKAVIAVDLYGQCADLAPIRRSCRRRGIPLIEDAAEALGATYKGKPAGSFGWSNIFSFNGNKIITTSSGGMLATNDGKLARHARFLATQARDPAPHYQHSEIGFNYRLSNLLAGVGLAQLDVLRSRVRARRAIFMRYRKALSKVDGVSFMPEPSFSRSTRWLTCIRIDPERFGADRETVRLRLEEDDIESRPLWKPMHLQPVFSRYRKVGGSFSEGLFLDGLCLPSASTLTERDTKRVVAAMLSCRR